MLVVKQKLEKTFYRIHILINKIRRYLSAAQIVVFSFLLIIALGSLLLLLPVSSADGKDSPAYIDCLFTAVSATCVTGLVTVTTAIQWSVFGQIIIIIMIQIGGLGLITLFTYFFVNIGRKISMKERMTIQASFNQNTSQGMVRMVRMAIRGTFLAEGIGAILLTLFFWLDQGVTFGRAVYYGIFHSISSFCNAGFDVIGETSLQEFAGDALLNLTVMMLIIIGGIGFTVWKDILTYLKYHWGKMKGRPVKFSLHTKLAVFTTLILIISGAVYFFATEYTNPNTLGELSLGGKIWAAFFQSATLRTAGFFTINQCTLTESSKFVSSLFMLIGGSPGGTAGGIKTVTLAIAACSIWTTLKGRGNIEIMKRRIPMNTLRKSITVMGVMLILWFVVATVMEFTEAGSAFSYTFMDLLYEVSSALGTVGVTTGITPYLSIAGKILIMVCMFIGRLGPISIAASLQHKLHVSDDNIKYPEEDVLIG